MAGRTTEMSSYYHECPQGHTWYVDDTEIVVTETPENVSVTYLRKSPHSLFCPHCGALGAILLPLAYTAKQVILIAFCRDKWSERGCATPAFEVAYEPWGAHTGLSYRLGGWYWWRLATPLISPWCHIHWAAHLNERVGAHRITLVTADQYEYVYPQPVWHTEGKS